MCLMAVLMLNLAKNKSVMSRLSDEWCCMNCIYLDDCLISEPNMNLLDYCLSYMDIENEGY